MSKTFMDILAAEEVFREFSTPISDPAAEEFRPYTYYMRSDGALVFCTAVFSENGRPLILGEPVRFPRILEMDTLARRETLFNRPFYSITKVCSAGSMENAQDVQKREVSKIIEASEGQILPLRERAYYTGAAFRPEEFSYAFSPRTAYRHAVAIGNEKVAETTKWVTGASSITPEDLGMTGSAMFGIIDADDEDVDMVYFGDLETLLTIRRAIRDGVERGLYRPLNEFGKIWPLRIWLSDRVQQCPFFVLKNPSDSFVHGSEVLEIEPVAGTLEVTVTDDSMNMVSPIVLGIGEVRIGNSAAAALPLILNNTFYRGDFYEGDRLSITRSFTATLATPDRGKIKVYLVREWNVVHKAESASNPS